MKYISSQHYINWDVVEEKMKAMKGADRVVIPFSYVGEIDGEEYAAQCDGHHTLAAARELGLEIVFEVKEDSEGLTGHELLETRYIDGDWYDVENSDPAAEQFDLVW